ncbi:MAG: hypothetical protein M1833_006485 [Piccolia ochrophora]|nr:MAG: hypothetical protein M1833_006485 [Piccolia ochrophora]
MASSSSAPVLRHFISRRCPSVRLPQRRWAQVHDVRFLATHREPDRVLEKYKDKLQRKAKDEGLEDVHQLRQAYKGKITNLRKNAAAPSDAAHPSSSSPTPPSNTVFPPPPPPPRQPDAPSPTASGPSSSSKAPVKPLSSYIDIPKTLSLPTREIEYIWRLRHASSPSSLCAVIPATTYERIADTARRHPQFILPLPREGQGAEIHFLQWTFPTPDTATVLFTHLAEYKLRGEYSQPHTTVTHHLDLSGPKGLVLLQGSVVEGRGVSVEEGKWLLMCLQKFYGLEQSQKGARKKLLEQFSQGDGGFKVEELLEEAERIS